MGNEKPQVDMVDGTGETHHYNGDSLTTEISLPPAPIADRVVSEVFINTQDQGGNANDRLEVNYDPANNVWMPFKRNTIAMWFVRGQQSQIKIRSQSGASIKYRIVINFEEC